MAKRSFYIKESELDDFQRQIVNRKADTSLIVTGCAGSGKSVLAFWKYHDIKKKQLGSVQVIVFTTSLKGSFVEACRSVGLDTHGIRYWREWQNEPWSSDYIIVDEAQDFSREQIEYFMRCANKALLLYGDSSQQIYNFLERKGEAPRVNMEEIQRITSYPRENLVFNHRLPKTVARVAEKLNAEGDPLEDRCVEEGTEKPYFLSCSSLDDQIGRIVEIIKSRRFDDVGILLPNNDDAKYVSDELMKRGLSVEVKHHGDSSIKFSTSNPKVMTYHSAKGLQFEAVFLPKIHEGSLDSFIEPLYVAMTRTYGFLYVLYTGNLPSPLQALLNSDLIETTLVTRETAYL